MLDHRLGGGVVVSDVLLEEFVAVLLVNGCGDGFDCHGIDNHREMVIRPAELLIFLKLDEVPTFCCVRVFGWTRSGWLSRAQSRVALEVTMRIFGC